MKFPRAKSGAARTSRCYQIGTRGAFSFVLFCLLAPMALRGSTAAALQTTRGRGAPQAGASGEASNTSQPLGRAAALLESGRFEEAEAAHRKILKADPRNAEGHTLLGVI